MDRVSAIRSMFDISGFGLELGPSYSAIYPKSEGFNVEILDHATQRDLREKYKKSSDVGRIEPVDYVSDGRSMQQVIGARKRYDFIVASHVIEYMTDIVGFMRNCETLLKDTGTLVLVISDKRYCFDYFRPLSTTGQAIDAYRRKRTRHSFADIFDHRAYAARTTNDGSITWPVGDYPQKRLVHFLTMAFEDTEKVDSGPHIDIHAWQFTPSSFWLIIHELNTLGFTVLKELSSDMDTEMWECRIALSHTGAGCDLSRLDLLKAIRKEDNSGNAVISVP